MPTFRIDFAYDGSGFRGFARQSSVRTVQGELERALARALRQEVVTVGAGRTDAGVHARGQVVSFSIDREIDLAAMQRSINRAFAGEIVVDAVAQVADDFSARFSAKSRSYRYRVLNRELPDPLLRKTVWHIAETLNFDAMRLAAAGFVGEHDFSSFCRRSEGRGSVRNLLEARWDEEGPLLVFSVRATAFCHQMVRSLVGFCVDVGRGKVDASSVSTVLEARDRNASRPMAPPQGLILWEVGY